MSDLFGTLHMAARALEAQRFGLDVAGHNIANVNTPGYARRTASLSALPPADAKSAGRGVEVEGVKAIRDALLERRVRGDLSARDFYSASAGILAQVEAAVGLPGQSIDAEMLRFFDAFARLAEDPTSAGARLEVLSEGESLASSFRAMAGELDRSQREADRYIREEVDAINELAQRIALLNGDMAKVPADRQPLHERDQVVQAIRELSQHLDVVVIERGEDRAFDVYFGNGRPLVVGDNAFSLSAVSTGPSGLADIEHEGISVVGEIAEGYLGGYLHVRDVQIPSYITRLDQMAYTLAEEVNTLHDTGYDLNGVDAGNFFTPIGAVAGAASAFTVDATVAGDVSLIAAAAVAEPGDNQVARQISDLRDQRVLGGGTATFADAWGQLAFQVGSDAATANIELDGRSEAARQSMGAWDSVSAVSLDEEAFQITRFQSAYEANAVLFRTINDMLDTLMRMVGV